MNKYRFARDRRTKYTGEEIHIAAYSRQTGKIMYYVMKYRFDINRFKRTGNREYADVFPTPEYAMNLCSSLTMSAQMQNFPIVYWSGTADFLESFQLPKEYLMLRRA